MLRRTRLNVTTLETREVLSSELVYALQLNGLTSASNLKVSADAIGNTYVTGNFTGTVDLNPSSTATFNVTSKGGTDIFVAKYGVSGQFLWGKTLGGAGNDTVSDIAFDTAGSSYIVGTFNGTVDFNPDTPVANMTATSGGSAFLWKLGFNGNLVFGNMVAGRSTSTGIAVDSRGNAVISGQFFGTADFNPSNTVTNNLSTTNSAGASYLLRINSTGSYAWARAIQSTGSVELSSIALDGAGNVVAGGRFTGNTDFDPGTTNFNINGGSVWTLGILKLNTAGNFLWAKSAAVTTTSLTALNSLNAIQIDSQGNVYAAGQFGGEADFDPGTPSVKLKSIGGTDGFTWKLSSAGAYLWAKRYGTTGDDTVTDLSIDRAGNNYVIGQFQGTGDFDPGTAVANLVSGAGINTFLLKLTNAGNLGMARTFGNGSSTTNGASIWADGAGNIYSSGSFTGTADFDTAATQGNRTTTTSAGFITKLYVPSTAPIKPVNQTPINASAGGPYTIGEGNGLAVRATASDPDAGTTLTYSWDLNGDGIFGDAVGANPVLTPAQLARLGLNESRTTPYNVRVQVSDGVNIPIFASTTLRINNTPPTAVFSSGSSRAFEGFGTYVRFASPSDPSAADTRAGFRYSYDFNGDGVFDIGNGTSYAGSVTSTQQYVRNQWAESGTRTIIGRVFDRDGGFRDYRLTIRFDNLAPTATFTSTGVQTVGSQITFRFTNIREQSPGDFAAGFTYSYDWNNDGVFDVVGSNASATHVFQGPGRYQVRGRITDRDGGFTDGLLTLNIT